MNSSVLKKDEYLHVKLKKKRNPKVVSKELKHNLTEELYLASEKWYIVQYLTHFADQNVLIFLSFNLYPQLISQLTLKLPV